jgi:hypothetical protein
MAYTPDKSACSVDPITADVSEIHKKIYKGEVHCPLKFCAELKSVTSALECAIVLLEDKTWKVNWSADGEYLQSALTRQQDVYEMLNEAYMRGKRDPIDVKIRIGRKSSQVKLFFVCRLSSDAILEATNQKLLLVLLHPLHIAAYFQSGCMGNNSIYLHDCKNIAQSWVSWILERKHTIDTAVKSLRDEEAFPLQYRIQQLENAKDPLIRMLSQRYKIRMINAVADAVDADKKKTSSDARLEDLEKFVKSCEYQRSKCPNCPSFSTCPQVRSGEGELMRLSLWRHLCGNSSDRLLKERQKLLKDIQRISIILKKSAGRDYNQRGMRIDRFTLRKLLLGEILDSSLTKQYALPKMTPKNSLNKQQTRAAYTYATQFIPAIVQCIQDFHSETPESPEVIEKFLWLIGQFTHHYLGVEPRLNVYRHLHRLLRNEPALHA